MPLTDELVTIERTLWTNDRQIYDERLEGEAFLVFPETWRYAQSRGPRGNRAGESCRAEVGGGGLRRRRGRGRDIRRGPADLPGADARWGARIHDQVRAPATSLYVRRAGGWMLAFHQQSYPEGVKALAALPSLPRDTRRHAFGALAGRAAAIGACAIGACAIGATALGAVAIGRLAVGAFAARRGRIRRLTIDQLQVGSLRVDNVLGDRVVRLS